MPIDDNLITLGERFAALIRDKTTYMAGAHWAARALSDPIAKVEHLDQQIDSYTDRAGWIVLTFASGTKLCLGGSPGDCCANHYITCDDDLDSFVGGMLRYVEVVTLDDQDDEYGDRHEQTFVKVETTQGCLTFTSHNEHNGYYGGIIVRAIWLELGQALSSETVK